MSSTYSQFEDSDFIRETVGPAYQPTTNSYNQFPQTLHIQPSKKQMLRDVNFVFKQKMQQMEAIFRKTLQSITKSEEIPSNKNRDCWKKGMFYQNTGKHYLEYTSSTGLENILDITPIHSAYTEGQTQPTSDEILINQKKIGEQINKLSYLISNSSKKTHKTIPLLNFPQVCSNIEWNCLKPEKRFDQSYLQLHRTNANMQNRSEQFITYTEQQTSRIQNSQNLVSSSSSKAVKKPNKMKKKHYEMEIANYSSDQMQKMKKETLNKIKERIQFSPHTVGHSAGANHLLKRLSRQKNERQALISKIKLKIK